MIKNLVYILCIGICAGYSQEKESLSLIFMGDIMGHNEQIEASYDYLSGTYDYTSVFKQISPLIKSADIAIANLEVTLAGKPYKGYPQFCSPDALAVAVKEAGVDVLVTANNHSCDRGKKGVLRTLSVLDSLGIAHTGTFQDSISRVKNNLLVLEKNGIKVGLLNYTYGTNGLPTPKPTIVNRIDKKQIKKDIEEAKNKKLDKLIVMLHWGLEYKRRPSKKQRKLANFLFSNGVDVIIGGHPHVIQGLEYKAPTETEKEHFIAYSLGNFVSNQRDKTKDGGMMVALTFSKDINKKVSISEKGYYLTWVHRPKTDNKRYRFEILPCSIVEKQSFKGLGENSKEKMKYFIEDSRKLLKNVNKNVFELKRKRIHNKLRPYFANLNYIYNNI